MGTELTSWEDVDKVLVQLAKATARRDGAIAAEEAELVTIRMKHDNRIESAKRVVEGLEGALRTFIREHAGQLVGRRTLAHGIVGMRKLPPSLVLCDEGKVDWKQAAVNALKRLPETLRATLVRTKHEIAKTAFKAAIEAGSVNAKLCQEIGVRVAREEEPFWELG